MKIQFRPPGRHSIPAAISLLALLAIAACSSVASNPAAQPGVVQAALPTSAATAAQPTMVQAAGVATLLAPTMQADSAAPSCTAPAALTVAVTEGPYFKANSPERTSLLDPGVTGTQLTLTGYVLTADCKPIAYAMLDFWQANAQGQYDNTSYTLRGHQFTDANGRYQLVTIDPGLYPGRTEHIHVKVQAPDGPILTTQLFFPGVAENQSDSIYDPSLLVNVQSSGASMQATFTFIVSLK